MNVFPISYIQPLIFFIVCYSFWPFARINLSKICAANSQKEPQPSVSARRNCITSPGSPLTLYGHPDKLIGILTKSARCGSLHPKIFINVARYRHWIDINLRRNKLNPIISNIVQILKKKWEKKIKHHPSTKEWKGRTIPVIENNPEGENNSTECAPETVSTAQTEEEAETTTAVTKETKSTKKWSKRNVN